jgi:two-component system, sensor histidine kinase RegB
VSTMRQFVAAGTNAALAGRGQGPRALESRRMVERSSPPWLLLLSNLRWLAIAGQVVTLAVVTGPLGMALPAAPLWSGVGALAAFNVYATWRARRDPSAESAEVFAHVLVDIALLTWMIGWSGGVENPFASLFLLPIALSILALRGGWIRATAAASLLGFALSAVLARPLPHVHGFFGDAFSLHKVGMMATFVVSAAVLLIFFTRMAGAWRESERKVAQLQERFTRNEGITALATHAASVAHELNTPLGTLMLMVEDLASDAGNAARREDYATMRTLLETCRDCVRDLASPAETGHRARRTGADVDRTIERWRLIRPTTQLHRSGSIAGMENIDPAVDHLIQALLNNAADASQSMGASRVDLHIEASGQGMQASIRDYGPGFADTQPVLPGTLFRTSKQGGMGIGLALSHATVERLGGSLSMQAATDGPGVVVSFHLPVTMSP